MALVKVLLAEAVDLGERHLAYLECCQGYTAWHYAAMTGNELLLKVLLEFDKVLLGGFIVRIHRGTEQQQPAAFHVMLCHSMCKWMCACLFLG